MPDCEMQMPQPSHEHKRLEEHCGVWNVECTFYMDHGQPPMKVRGRETIEMFGAFWTTSLFESEMFGLPFKGRATLGYDPAQGKYVSSWIDTMMPQIYSFTGAFNGNVLEMSGRGFDSMSGGPADFRTTETHSADGTRTLEMFMTPRGSPEMKLFTHVYSRVD